MFTLSYTLDIFVYQRKLGLCIVNRPCNVSALLGCPRLDLVHVRHVFCKETVYTLKRNKQINNHFICTAILFLSPFIFNCILARDYRIRQILLLLKKCPGPGNLQ